ncbi:putative neuralized-like protein 4-like [Apostichopus japonicus]|uniref:Putative neuralized-like protein 4-like n=1 Tax=Stichopus japonicus TaxID=307972 RepID=A0A2G8KYH8_STIJA|nr:putative neuralized-like protein 4-like [Apostichopus japonicus]
MSVLLPSLGLPAWTCHYQELCASFKETLGLPDGFFEVSVKLSKCYCHTCHKHRGELLYGGLAYSSFHPQDKEHSSEAKQVLMSPTIKYAGSDLFCEKHKFTDVKNKKTYSVRVAFQVLVKPGCYTVTGENNGANQPIDPYFENREIRWNTKEKDSVVLSALLIKVD